MKGRSSCLSPGVERPIVTVQSEAMFSRCKPEEHADVQPVELTSVQPVEHADDV